MFKKEWEPDEVSILFHGGHGSNSLLLMWTVKDLQTPQTRHSEENLSVLNNNSYNLADQDPKL